ncbi:MAG: hypothetical protein Q8934_22675 [Bacillota bacterium]|nr:hypothetical protein [Bacillota bacterium]
MMTTIETQTKKIIKYKSTDEIFEEVNAVLTKVFGNVEVLTDVQHKSILTTYIEVYEKGFSIHHYENVINSIKSKIPLIRDGKSLEVIIKKSVDLYLEQKYNAAMQKIHLFRNLTFEQLREYRVKNIQNK